MATQPTDDMMSESNLRLAALRSNVEQVFIDLASSNGQARNVDITTKKGKITHHSITVPAPLPAAMADSVLQRLGHTQTPVTDLRRELGVVDHIVQYYRAVNGLSVAAADRLADANDKLQLVRDHLLLAERIPFTSLLFNPAERDTKCGSIHAAADHLNSAVEDILAAADPQMMYRLGVPLAQQDTFNTTACRAVFFFDVWGWAFRKKLLA